MQKMKLLKTLCKLNESKSDLSRLPEDVMNAIKRKIREGAKDLDQKWANALEIVHRAYEVEGVERPDPSMDTAWEQYEENIAYAVQQLAKHRGMEDDWRMSSAMFHEALEKHNKYKVIVGESSYVIEAANVDQVIDTLKENTTYDVNVEKHSDDHLSVTFSRWNIHKNTKVHVIKV
jgi:hypothetical protein